MSHHHVPTKADCIFLCSNGVVLGQTVLEEALGVGVSVGLVSSAEHNKCNLKNILRLKDENANIRFIQDKIEQIF